MTEPADHDVQAEHFVAKLRAFSDTLDADERLMFATLVGPGVASLYESEDEVAGFGADGGGAPGGPGGVDWDANSIRSQLNQALQNSAWRIVDER